ncbi:TRAP transporter substrate-binding protein DctP [Sneathiella sp.]|jgi:TRAP-type C4-dicarboxylate transport system substrate-binding protein|uniref:TRAP transporter substrate-binding protein DctP n=1 Tax=Sneathiella sp. TaxID=1964365 RepID=UPI0039E56F5F
MKSREQLKKSLKISAIGFAIFGGLMNVTSAEEVTLKAVSAFANGTTFTKNFQRFVDKVNEIGPGVLKINYLGGGKAVLNPFELGNAIKTGVVDIGNLPGAFYTNIVPEADAIKLTQFTIQEERKNGAWAYMNDLHVKKMNAYHLARQKDCVPFHLYLTKKIETPDLSGMNIRTTPIYSAFFSSLGGSMIRTPPGDVYTALERGAVDGYGWPTQGVLDLGWHEVTKYRVDPGFYRASVEVLINNNKWDKLGKQQKAILKQASMWMEGLCTEDKEINATEIKRQAEAGIEVISFDGDYVQKAYDAGWDAFLKANPEHGPKLKELLTK